MPPERLSAAVERAPQALSFAPALIGQDDGEVLHVLSLPDGGGLELRGALRRDALAGDNSPALRAAASLQPTLAALGRALRGAPPAPLTRDRLLRGGGYRQLFLELTGQCNERCVHCYADSGPERTAALDADQVDAALEDAADLGFEAVQLTGGDPLISPLCVPAAQRARALGIGRVEVYTNGLALHGRRYEDLCAADVAFAFSFYSADPQVHDAITATPGSQARTLAAIARVVEDGRPCRVSIVVTEANHAQLGSTIDVLRTLGVAAGRIGVAVQHTAGRGLMGIQHAQLQLPPGLGTASHGPVAESGQSGESGGATEGASDGGTEDNAFSGRVAVTYDGLVVPCIFSRAVPLGDLRRQRLAAILRDPRPVRPAAAEFRGCLTARRRQLSCWECRVRTALLAGAP